MLSFTPSQKSPTPSTQSQTQPLPITTPPQHTQPIDNSITATSERAINYLKTTWNECRPWQEFYSTRHISLPKFSSLSDRFATNLHLYAPNYQFVAAFWLAFVLLGFIPNVLVGAALLFLLQRWCTWRASKTNYTLQHKDQIIAGLVTLTVLWLTGLAMFALASLAFSAISVSLHASLHEPNNVETEIATV